MDYQDYESNPEGFVIDNDSLAEWALERIKEDMSEYDRMIDCSRKKIEEYQQKIDTFERQKESKTAFLRGKLWEYFDTVPHRKTDTQEVYRLPSGTLRLKSKKPEFIPDKDKLLEHLKKTVPSLVKVTEAPMWGEYKKQLDAIGDKAVDKATGEIVDFVTVSPREPEFVVEVKA